jgi:bacteriorhodopsin
MEITSSQNLILLITFAFEMLSGGALLWLGVTRFRLRKTDDVSEEEHLRAGFTQMIIMGLVNIFSSMICYAKVLGNVQYGDSEWLDYVQFGLCTPPMIAVLCLVCSIDLDITLALSLCQGFVILCGYIGHISIYPGFKYSWFAFGCVFFLFLFGVLLYEKRKLKNAAIEGVQSTPVMTLGNVSSLQKKRVTQLMVKQKLILRDAKLSNRLITLTLVTWSLYPVTWLVIEADTISPATADIVHSVLAFFAKVTFSLVLGYYRASLGYDSVMSTFLPAFQRPPSAKKGLESVRADGNVPPPLSIDAHASPSPLGGFRRRQSVEMSKSADLRKSTELIDSTSRLM